MYLLDLSDVAVIPSFYPEGLPTVILEAGISKCAVITTDAGGSLEVIKNNYNGFVIKRKSAESITEKLELLYKNRELLQYSRDNLYKTIKEKFLWDKSAENLINKLNNSNS